MKISVTIITLNEEKYLPRALQSIESLANEIILVDSGSTDKTLEIAKKYGAKIFKRKFDNYANQKNFASSKATGEWILSLDADEKVSSELRQEIDSCLRRNDKVVAYSMPRKNIILGKFIKYSRWQPELDRHIWLWKKDKGKWVGDVHEELQINGKVGKLKFPKIHEQYDTVLEFLDMINKYSTIEASQKKHFSYFKMFMDPTYNFLVRYFYRLGFLDGWRGFVLSFLMGVYHFELWIKVWVSQQSEKIKK